MQAQVVSGADANACDVGRAACHAVHELVAVAAVVLRHGVTVARPADCVALTVRLDGLLASDEIEMRKCDGEVGCDEA